MTVVMTAEGGCRTVVCFFLSFTFSAMGLDWIAKLLCLAKGRIECMNAMRKGIR